MNIAKSAALAGVVTLFGGAAFAQEITLRVAHPLAPAATAQQKIIIPWCDKIGKETGGKVKCQIFPAMQLGGTPAQLFDQVKDGVADVVWTIPTYQAGRFSKSEAFELPFMTKTATGSSQAYWDYIQANALDEYKGTKLILVHVHDGNQLHMTKKEVHTKADLAGLKIRAPTRIGGLALAALGATQVQMPIPAVTESISKGVIDGAAVPWEIATTIKLNEVAPIHVETDRTQAKFSNAIFAMAINQAKYDSLPDDVKKVIDANSGREWSKIAGEAFDQAGDEHRAIAVGRNEKFIALSPEEYAVWQKDLAPVVDQWKKEVAAKGGDGDKLLESARSFIKKYDN